MINYGRKDTLFSVKNEEFRRKSLYLRPKLVINTTLYTMKHCLSTLQKLGSTLLVASLGGVVSAQTVLVDVPSLNGQLQKTWQKAVDQHPIDSAAMFYDFGQAAFGQIQLDFPDGASANDTLYLHLGECIKEGRVDRNPGGSRRYLRLRVVPESGQKSITPAIPHDRRNTRRPAILMPKEVGEVYPFRYVEIEGGAKCTPQRIMVTCPFDDEASYFHCDNDTLNQVWELCKHSIKATTYTGYYVDGDRERISYEADALINLLCHYAVDAQYDVAQRTFEHLLREPTWPTEWILQMNMVAWYDYLFTGNTSLIEKHYDELKAHSLMALRNDSVGLISSTQGQSKEFLKSIARKDKISDIVDWPHSGILGLAKGQGGEDDGYVYTDFNTVVNAYHYIAVRMLGEMAKAIGRKADAKYYASYCKQFQKDFNRQLFDATRGVYVDGIGTDHASLHANMFAMAFGLVPKQHRKSVSDFIVSRGMKCSVYGSQFLLDALYEAGEADYALQLMTATDNRSWMNMLREGSTITMEAWGNEWKPNQDWNHAWGAAPANIIPMRLMGIRPIEPGCKVMEIHPQTSTIRNAECRFPTPLGSIEVEIKEGKLSYSAPKGIKVKVKQ